MQLKTAACRIFFQLKPPKQPVFKETSNYPDFLHIWMARRPKFLFFYYFFFFLILSPRMQQSVQGHSAAMLAGNDSDMQGIHPVMYLLSEYNHKVTDPQLNQVNRVLVYRLCGKTVN
jgi:hypothetical protein